MLLVNRVPIKLVLTFRLIFETHLAGLSFYCLFIIRAVFIFPVRLRDDVACALVTYGEKLGHAYKLYKDKISTFVEQRKKNSKLHLL